MPGCAGLEDLEFLPSGDAALTRRATKYSGRLAVVVRFSRSRGRYERQGILVEIDALEKAEQECAEDADERAAAGSAGRRAARTRSRIGYPDDETNKTLFPGCPPGDAAAIAQHTAVRGSGRVGRTAAGRTLEERDLTAAVLPRFVTAIPNTMSYWRVEWIVVCPATHRRADRPDYAIVAELALGASLLLWSTMLGLTHSTGESLNAFVTRACPLHPRALVARNSLCCEGQTPAPKLVSENGRHALLVDGTPYLVLGAQIGNQVHGRRAAGCVACA